MHQKKALSYVDLAVSAGVFILYLVIALVIFRPGIASDFRGDLLTGIIEQNIRNEIYWSAQRYPIFIDNPTFPSLGGDFEYALNFKFPFDKLVINNRTSKIIDSNLNELAFEIDNTPDNNISVQYILKHKSPPPYKDIIYFVYFPSSSFSPQESPTALSIFATTNSFEVQYGVKETLSGVSLDKFNFFLLKDYASIKRQWGYPDSREFSLELFDGKNIVTSSAPIYKYQKVIQASSEVPVYVLEYVDLILYPNTTRQIVTVRIKAW